MVDNIMTFEEWVKKYEEKTGDEHYLPDGFVTLYDAEKGYAQYGVGKNMNRLYVYECCGDGRHWYDVGVKICRDNKIPYMVTICTRSLMPYLRLLRFKITKKDKQSCRNDGWKLEGVNHLGKRFFVFAAWWDERKQENAYYVVSEVI